MIANIPFTRCPRLSLGADEQHVLQLASEDYLATVGPRERRRMPAKLVQAVDFVQSLKGEASGR